MAFTSDTPGPVRRVPLTLIAGVCTTAAAELADVFRARPGTAVVHHDLRQITEGVVRRRLSLGTRDEVSVLELAHGCVSCTLREDLLPLVRRLAARPGVRRIVVRLDEALEPEPVWHTFETVPVGDRPVTDAVELDGVFTVLDRATWFGDATGDVTVAGHGLRAGPDNDRTLAQLVLAQVEFADVLVCAGAPDPWTFARTDAVLDRLAAGAPRLPLRGLDVDHAFAAIPASSRRGELTDPHGRLLRGEPPLDRDAGVSTLLFSARRPFHPERLHTALDVLLDGVVRTRGRVWVASQPDAALWLESAGSGLSIEHAGPWLASPDGPAWENVSHERRAAASLRWDPRFGDRAQELMILTHRASSNEIAAALNHALLTDAELAAGPTQWATYHDPFGDGHTEPCDDTVIPDGRADTTNTGYWM